MKRLAIFCLALLVLGGCQLAPAPAPTPLVRPPTRVPAAGASATVAARTSVSGAPTVTPQPLAPSTPLPLTPAPAAPPSASPAGTPAAQAAARPEGCALLPWVRRLPGLRIGAQLSAAPDFEAQLYRATLINASWVSVPVRWAELEPLRGQLALDALDAHLNASVAAGLRPLLVVRDTPAWAASSDVLPRDPADLAAFLAALGARYASLAPAYQIWELPNKAQAGRSAASPDRYAEALVVGAKALRAADPCALVLAGGLLPTRASDPAVALDDLAYYQKLATYDNGAARAAYDAVAVWLLTGNSAPGDHSKDQDERYRRFTYLERLRNELVYQGDADKQLWVTLGWALRPGGDELEAVDPRTQAEFVLKAIARTRERHPWVATLLFRGMSAQEPVPGEADYRLVAADGRPLRAFEALVSQPALPAQPDPRKGFTGPAELGLLWRYGKVGDPAPGAALAPDGSLRVATGGQWSYSIDANGAFRWNYRLGGQQRILGLAVGPDSTSYIGSDKNLLVAVGPDANTRWDLLLPEAISQAPTVGAQRLYVPLAGSLVVLRLDDGALLWQLPLGARPGRVAVAADGTAFLGTTDGLLQAIAPDGQPRWSFPSGKWARGAPLILDDGTLIVGNDAGQVFALDGVGKLRWRFDGVGALAATPALGADGSIYVPSSEGLLYALGPDGSLRWQAALPGAAVLSPAVGANGTIVVASGSSLSALDGAGKLRWRFEAEARLSVAPQLGIPGVVISADDEGNVYGVGLLGLRERMGWR